MFFQLAEIEKIMTSAQAMETSKEALSKLVFSSYTSSSTIKKELSSTVENILKEAKANCDVLQEIEDNALHGYFIPSTFEIDQLIMDNPGLPEWFAVVFQKQFEKQKQALDLTAKKLYSYLNLSESKLQYERQLQAFKILSDRYKSLYEKDKVIDIISEAEKVKNKGNMVIKKYGSFCQQIASKMIDFFQQICKRCQNFSNPSRFTPLPPPISQKYMIGSRFCQSSFAKFSQY